jgi:hypothetical protein
LDKRCPIIVCSPARSASRMHACAIPTGGISARVERRTRISRITLITQKTRRVCRAGRTPISEQRPDVDGNRPREARPSRAGPLKGEAVSYEKGRRVRQTPRVFCVFCVICGICVRRSWKTRHCRGTRERDSCRPPSDKASPQTHDATIGHHPDAVARLDRDVAQPCELAERRQHCSVAAEPETREPGPLLSWPR